MVMKILRFWKFSSRTNFGRIKARFFLEISRIKFFYFRFHKKYSVLWAKFYFSPFLHAPVAVDCHCWRSLKNHGVGVEIWSQLIWRIFCFIIIIGQVRGSPTDQSDLVKILNFSGSSPVLSVVWFVNPGIRWYSRRISMGIPRVWTIQKPEFCFWL